MIQRLFGIVVAVLLLASGAAVAHTFDPDKVGGSIVKVVTYNGTNILREGSGFVVDIGGIVVTNWHLIDRGDRTTVISLVTGGELAAEIIGTDEGLDIAILKVEGLDTPPLFFSAKPGAETDIVFSLGSWDGQGTSVGALTLDMASGSVGSNPDLEIERDVAAPFLIHNAMILRQGYGGPLVNACGEVVGMNRPAPGLSGRRVRQGVDPDQAVHALSAETLQEFLLAGELLPSRSSNICLTEIERAALSTEQAEAEKDEAERAAAIAKTEAEEAARRAEELERKAIEAQQQAETSAEDRRRAQEAARTARAEAQRKAIEANELAGRAQQLETRLQEAEQAADATEPGGETSEGGKSLEDS